MNDGESTGLAAARPRKRHPRLWIKRSCFVFGVLIGLYIVSRATLNLWIYFRLPADAPNIAFSMDDTWLNRLGLTRSTYDQAMTRAGGRLIVLRPEDGGVPNVDAQRVETLLEEKEIDGLLLSGGGDVEPSLYGGAPEKAILVNEHRDQFEIALIRQAVARNLPILGICRGCQILNVALGGTLRNLREDEPLKNHHFSLDGHAVDFSQGSRLARLFGVSQLADVYSFHGQAVDRLGRNVQVAATADDGVIEAIEVEPDSEETWMVAVQWHPEMAPGDATQDRLFQTFVEQARKARQRRLAAPGDEGLAASLPETRFVLSS